MAIIKLFNSILFLIILFFIFYPIEKEFYGYINKNGKFVIPAKFDDAFEFIDGLAIVKKKCFFGIINKKGIFIANPEYHKIFEYSENLAVVSKKTSSNHFKYGYLNKNGKISIKIEFDFAKSFSNGLAPVKINNKWGFINKKGIFVIPAKYNNIIPFFKDITIVKYKNKYLKINKSGIVLKELFINKIISYNKSDLLVEKNGEKFWINRNGKKLVNFDNNFKFIDKNNNIVSGKFDEVSLFNNNIGIAYSKYPIIPSYKYKFVIKKNGSIIHFPFLKQFLKINKGFKKIDNKLKNAFPEEMLEYLKYCFKNNKGQITIEQQIINLQFFKKNLLKITKRFSITLKKDYFRFESIGYINTNGEYISFPKLSDNFPQKENLSAILNINRKWGFIDKNGKFIIEPKFIKAKSFSEGLAAVKIKKNIPLFNIILDNIYYSLNLK